MWRHPGARLARLALILVWGCKMDCESPEAVSVPEPLVAPTPSKPPAVPPKIAALFERASEVVGDSDVRTTYCRGPVSAPDMKLEGTFETWGEVPGRNRTVVDLPSFGRIETGFDGELAWIEDPNGLRLQPEIALPDIIIGADPHIEKNYATHFKKFEGPFDDEFGGQPADRIDLTATSGRLYKFYFSRSDGFMIGNEHDDYTNGQAVSTRSVVSEFKRFAIVRTSTSLPGYVTLGSRIESSGAARVVVGLKTCEFNSPGFRTIEAPVELKKLLAGRKVSGKVVKGDEPVERAEVKLVQESEGKPMVTTTNSDGQFGFEGVRDRFFRLEARSGAGVAFLERSVPSDGDVDGVVLKLEDAKTLRVKTVDDEGAPLAGVAVNGYCGNRGLELRTDLEGVAETQVTSASCSLNAALEGYLRAQGTVKTEGSSDGGKPSTIELVLVRGAQVAGMVTQADGRPAANVSLSLQAEIDVAREQHERMQQVVAQLEADGRKEELERIKAYLEQREARAPNKRWQGVSVAQSDADGRFSFENAKAGPGRIIVTGRGKQKPFGIVAPAEDLKLTLEGAGVVTGLVLLPDAKPAAGASLILSPSDSISEDHSLGSLNFSGETKEDGTFLLEGVPIGPYAMETRFAPAHVDRRDVRVESAKPLVLTIRFAAGDRITGTVRDESGTPIFRAEVEAHGGVREDGESVGYARAETDGAGRFELKDLRPGIYTMSAQLRRGKSSGESNRARVRSGTDRVALVIRSNFTVRGVVQDESGKPIAEAYAGHEITQENGRFQASVRPGSSLYVRADGFRPKSVAVPSPGSKSELELPPITLLRERSLQGTVLLPDGAPAARAVVSASDAGQTYRDNAVTLPDGTFTLTGAPPGAVTLVASSATGSSKQLTVGAESGPIILRLEAGIKVSGRVVGADGRPVIGASVFDRQGRHHAECDAAGAFKALVLASGLHTLEGRNVEGRRFGPVTVTVGSEEITEVLLAEDVAGVDVFISVRDADGSPVTPNSWFAPGVIGRADEVQRAGLEYSFATGDPPRFAKVRPGTYTAFFQIQSWVHRHVFEVTADQPELRLEIQLPLELESAGQP
ncbi:MAG: carboxypeptidase regulatory-like domain-containing protein [Deltaproteobacteria bacterium]|nr:carboxypeptidase regulatory-like domain-containing protein [Deltaproteobacteria bacterium]